jgi:hypothetical protein
MLFQLCQQPILDQIGNLNSHLELEELYLVYTTTSNKQFIHSLTHKSKIQEEHLGHLDIEVTTNRHFLNLKFNPALIVSTSQDTTFFIKHNFRKISFYISASPAQKTSTNFFQGSTLIYKFLYFLFKLSNILCIVNLQQVIDLDKLS